MSNIFREVDDEFSEARATAWLHRYRYWLSAGLLLVVTFVAGYQYYQYSQKQSVQQATDRYIAATTQADATGLLPDGARLILTELLMSDNGYRFAAGFRLATHYLAAANTEQAQIVLQEMISDVTPENALYADYAQLLLWHTQFAAQQLSGDDYRKLLAEYATGAGQGASGAHWQSFAQLQLVELLLQQGERTQATEVLQQLSQDSGLANEIAREVAAMQKILASES